ncbi:MAG: ComEC/Rec2 family competence protein [Tannerella sp.]|jgi:competence protein ComEC|nr:ComEC/Rec2 family competence protein [Tannerella sp.]
MIEAIKKRPFIRPLFWWITGIVLQVCFPLQRWSLLLLLVLAGVVIFSLFGAAKKDGFSYNTRWMWGILLSGMFLFLAIQTTAYAERRLSEPAEYSWLQEKAQAAQEEMVARLDRLRLPDEGKAILATITINYRKAMSRDLRDRFSMLGVAHLLSVSGFHVAIVCGFLMKILSFFPRRRFYRWLKYFLILFPLWAFTYIAGLSTPAVRSALMFMIFLTGQATGRRPDRYNTLAAVAFCMLVYQPFYLFDVGFQLSFLAVFFILYLQPRFARLIQPRNPLLAEPWSVLTVTMAAQTGTFFLCCYYFGKSSAVFLFTNLFLSLLATVLIPVTLLFMLLPTGMPGYGMLQWALERLTECMLWIVDQFSRISWATFPLRFDFVSLIGSYLILGLLFYYFHSKRVMVLQVSLVFFILLLCRQLFF